MPKSGVWVPSPNRPSPRTHLRHGHSGWRTTNNPFDIFNHGKASPRLAAWGSLGAYSWTSLTPALSLLSLPSTLTRNSIERRFLPAPFDGTGSRRVRKMYVLPPFSDNIDRCRLARNRSHFNRQFTDHRLLLHRSDSATVPKVSSMIASSWLGLFALLLRGGMGKYWRAMVQGQLC